MCLLKIQVYEGVCVLCVCFCVCVCVLCVCLCLCLCVCVLQVYQPSTGDYVYYDKWYGRSITEGTALQGTYTQLSSTNNTLTYVMHHVVPSKKGYPTPKSLNHYELCRLWVTQYLWFWMIFITTKPGHSGMHWSIIPACAVQSLDSSPLIQNSTYRISSIRRPPLNSSPLN